MKTLIVYASKYGLTEELVSKIKQNLKVECDLLDAKKLI